MTTPNSAESASGSISSGSSFVYHHKGIASGLFLGEKDSIDSGKGFPQSELHVVTDSNGKRWKIGPETGWQYFPVEEEC